MRKLLTLLLLISCSTAFSWEDDYEKRWKENENEQRMEKLEKKQKEIEDKMLLQDFKESSESTNNFEDDE
jgi:hypothetical protein